jgi:predicted aminopeptidase
VALVQTYRSRLHALYQQPLAVDAKRAAKQRLFDDMKSEYIKLKASWGGYAGYDRWFAQKPNNALLASVAIYTQRVPAFEAMLREHDGNLSKFFEAVKALARQDRPAREAALRRYAPDGVSKPGRTAGTM